MGLEKLQADLNRLWRQEIEMDDDVYTPVDELVNILMTNYEPGGDLSVLSVNNAEILKSIVNGGSQFSSLNDQLAIFFGYGPDGMWGLLGNPVDPKYELGPINERVARGRIYINLAGEYVNADDLDFAENLYLKALVETSQVSSEPILNVAEVINHADSMNFYSNKLLREMAFRVDFSNRDLMNSLYVFGKVLGEKDPRDFYNEMMVIVPDEPRSKIEQYIALHHDMVGRGLAQYFGYEHRLSMGSISAMIDTWDAAKDLKARFRDYLIDSAKRPHAVGAISTDNPTTVETTGG